MFFRDTGAYEAGRRDGAARIARRQTRQPRNKPPFPAVVGLYGKPSAVNNVETLCNVH